MVHFTNVFLHHKWEELTNIDGDDDIHFLATTAYILLTMKDQGHSSFWLSVKGEHWHVTVVKTRWLWKVHASVDHRSGIKPVEA